MKKYKMPEPKRPATAETLEEVEEKMPSALSQFSEALAGIYRVDRYVRDNMWPHWFENGVQICDQCGYARRYDTGLCSANPLHKGKPYSNPSSLRSIGF